MKTVEINSMFDANVTQMRDGAAFGNGNEELLDGNMIPRLCTFAGEKACAKTCQLKELQKAEPEAGSDEAAKVENAGKLCAEKNILEKLDALHVQPENFVLVSATKDRVIFADEIDESGATRHSDGYTMVPEANGFYFRPGVDMTLNRHRRIFETTKRMADCGDVVAAGEDEHDQAFLGHGHFSRTNMHGPSAFMHDLNGEKVSWGEYFIGNGVEHFNADVSKMQVTLVAAVEGKDFLHYYADETEREAHFPGWNELGFMHFTGNIVDGKQECLINYREMIVWQLTDGIKNPKYRLSREQIRFEDAINTGDINLGHASHHKATHGEIAQGRDMYVVGFNKREAVAARIDELERLQAGREWTMKTFREMSDDDYEGFEKLWAEGRRELAQLYDVRQQISPKNQDK